MSSQPAPQAHIMRCALIVALLGSGLESALAVDQEGPPAELRQPWIQRANTLGPSDGLLVRSDLSAADSERLIQVVRQTRSAFDSLLASPPPRVLERPILMLFSDSDELEFTVRSEFVVPGIRAQGSAMTFGNEHGQFMLVSTDGPSALELTRWLRSIAAEQYLTARFGTRLPSWLHESLVQYAGTLHAVDSRLVSGEPPSDFVAILHDLDASGALLPLDRLVSIDREQWNSATGAKAAALQAQAWAALDFLLAQVRRPGPQVVQALIDDAVAGSPNLLGLDPSSTEDTNLASAWIDHVRGLEVGPVTRLRELAEQIRVLLEVLEEQGIRTVDERGLRTRFTAELERIESRIGALPGGPERVASGAIPNDLEVSFKETRLSRSPRALRALGLPGPPMSVALEQPGTGRVVIRWVVSTSDDGKQARWAPVVDW